MFHQKKSFRIWKAGWGEMRLNSRRIKASPSIHKQRSLHFVNSAASRMLLLPHASLHALLTYFLPISLHVLTSNHFTTSPSDFLLLAAFLVCSCWIAATHCSNTYLHLTRVQVWMSWVLSSRSQKAATDMLNRLCFYQKSQIGHKPLPSTPRINFLLLAECPAFLHAFRWGYHHAGSHNSL